MPKQKKQLKFESFERKFGLKSPCMKIRGTFRTMKNINDADDKTVPYFDKKCIMFDRVLNTLMMIMNVARY